MTSSVDEMLGKERKKPVRQEYCCTVVNLLPFELRETKPMIIPSFFLIPAAKGDVGGLGYVKEGLSFIPNPMIDEGKPGANIRQITPPSEMARSICEDYNCAHIALTDDAKPGVFWCEGRLVWTDVLDQYPEELGTARRQQNHWFKNLINLADADWQKNKNMMAVSDLQRIAASSLGVVKDWVNWIEPDSTMKCGFCQAQISVDSVKCFNCKEIVNVAKYKQMIQAQGLGVA